MAQRRMFSMKIVASDAFLDMPATSRELYFQLGMYADDDGFVSPRKVLRMLGCSEDDLKMLMAKKFVLPFENGVMVIKHWRLNNQLRKDRYVSSQYTEQKALLFIKDNGAYTFSESKGKKIEDGAWQPDGNQRVPQDSIGKVSIVKDILYKRPLKNGEEYKLSDGLRVKKAFGKIVTAATNLDVSARDYPEINELM